MAKLVCKFILYHEFENVISLPNRIFSTKVKQKGLYSISVPFT